MPTTQPQARPRVRRDPDLAPARLKSRVTFRDTSAAGGGPVRPIPEDRRRREVEAYGRHFGISPELAEALYDQGGSSLFRGESPELSVVQMQARLTTPPKASPDDWRADFVRSAATAYARSAAKHA